MVVKRSGRQASEKGNTMNEDSKFTLIENTDIARALTQVRGSDVRYAKSGGGHYDVYAASLTNRERTAKLHDDDIELFAYRDVIVIDDKMSGAVYQFILTPRAVYEVADGQMGGVGMPLPKYASVYVNTWGFTCIARSDLRSIGLGILTAAGYKED